MIILLGYRLCGRSWKAESAVSASERSQSRQPRSNNVSSGSQQTDVVLSTQYQKWICRLDIQPTHSIDDINKMQNLHALFQAVDPHLHVVLKNRNSVWYWRDDRLVVLEVWIFGPYDRCQIALLPSLIMPPAPFSDLSFVSLLSEWHYSKAFNE